MTKCALLTAIHWGTYRIAAKEGRVTASHAFEEDPDPSPIGQGMVDALDAPTRISAPMVRQSWFDNGPGTASEPGQSHESGYDFPFIAFSRYCSSQASVFLRPFMLALSLMFRLRLRLICLMAALFAGPLSVFRRLRASWKTTSMTQCSRFSMCQWARTAVAKRLAEERKSRRSVEVFPSRRTSA